MVVVGLAALGMAWMPAIGERLRVSYALIYLILGALLYAIFPSLPKANPLVHENFTVRLTELVVLVALKYPKPPFREKGERFINWVLG